MDFIRIPSIALTAFSRTFASLSRAVSAAREPAAPLPQF
jgi:hypothetical protein